MKQRRGRWRVFRLGLHAYGAWDQLAVHGSPTRYSNIGIRRIATRGTALIHMERRLYSSPSVLVHKGCGGWSHAQLLHTANCLRSPVYSRTESRTCLRALQDEALLSFLEFDVNSSLVSLREFLTAVPSASVITVLAVALTAAGSSLAYSSREEKTRNKGLVTSGLLTADYWLLTLNPTPFNKFVIARCPSICFDSDSSIDRDVHEKLNLDTQQVVNVRHEGSELRLDAVGLDYQRKCIPTEDGGVLALDWPSCLNLDGDHGLDTTLVLVPGTVQGSEDEAVRAFVQRALKTGHFPVVLNPRGCANSPLTTARIYSAGDSDDIRAAVSYISKSRPWTTLMGIAWGFGANMLTKYLGEEESLTPFTAAVSINNPFDLDEATKFMKRSHLHKELVDGYVSLLKSNKKLFQGQKNVDVADGLTVTSLREFDSAVSCPATGFKTLESFYRTASSGRLIDQVKTPLLCIQDDTATPLFSVPRTVFEINPFTTLLYSPMELENKTNINLSFEWFAAVEIALLKGRHPLLRGVDLTVKPSTSTTKALIDGTSEFIELEPSQDFWTSNSRLASEAGLDVDRDSNKSAEQLESGTSEENVMEEQGQVLQAAKTVFSALDVAMPGTLSDETKEQVLEAVGKGESIITALQNAVPEDVRGKMVTAVSAAVQARGISLQLVGFGKNFPAPTLPAGLKESIQENLSAVANNVTVANESSSHVSGNSDTQGQAKPGAGTQEEEGEKQVTVESQTQEEKCAKSEQEVQGEKQMKPEPETHGEAQLKSEQETQVEKQAVEAAATSQSSDAPVVNNETEDKDSKSQTDNSATVQEVNKKAENVQANLVPDTKPESREGSTEQTETSTINVQQAFQAFTGFDDSTQMAVNNVFGVLEGMLEEIEKENQRDVQAQHATPPAEEKQVKASAPAITQSSEMEAQESQELVLEKQTSKDLHQEDQTNELKEVQSRLKKTKISGFILNDNKASSEGKVSAVNDFTSKQAKSVVLQAMKVEVQRRIGLAAFAASAGLKEELLRVAEAVTKEVQHVRVYKDSSATKVLSAEALVNAVSSVFRDTSLLQRVVPFGVLVGVILASLVNSFVVVTTEKAWHETVEEQRASLPAASTEETELATTAEQQETRGLGKVVEAVSVAMGATAAFAGGGGSKTEGKEEEHPDDDDYHKENVVSNIAEKAFSFAAPVVPTKDGQIDHERLVTMLTDIGQKAGFLNFLAKGALLWGGLRGAMNVTERLLVFLRLAERPLHQRLLGFIAMGLLLWSPVLMPLLPALLNEWASRSSGRVATYASVVGLYGALIILVVIWGKQIRGYDDPLSKYGLKLNKLKLFGVGLFAGCGTVVLLYAILYQLGCLKFVSSFVTTATFSQVLHSGAKLARLTMEGTVIGVGVAVVEELLFRSWLVEEIAVDLGHHKAILLSGLLFSLLHRCPAAVPGLWFLALALSGARYKAAGNLALPIGLHAGLVAANFVYNCGGFIVYSSAPNWITGVHVDTPLTGIVGAAMAAVLALLLYPWKVLTKQTITS